MSADDALPIRSATTDDVPGIEHCVDAAYRHYIDRMGCKPGPMVDDYSRAVVDHDAFVIEEHGEIVAVLVLKRYPQTLLLDNVAIVPRCQRLGLGRRMIVHAESFARQLDYQTIELYTHETMHENLAMYARLGYVEVDRRIESGYQRVYMRKQLAG